MRKSTIRLITVTIAIIFAFSMNSNAQLKQGSIGIGSFFGGSTPTAMGHYALSGNMDIAVGVGFRSVTIDDSQDSSATEAKTTIELSGMFRYFLKKGDDVSPYVGGVISYVSFPSEEAGNYTRSWNNIHVGGIFGAQVYLAKQFAVYGHFVLGFSRNSENFKYETNSDNDYSNSETTISLSGSGIGAIFYF